MAFYIGLDAHKKTCVYQVKDESHKLVDRGTVPATPADLAVLAERYPGATVVVEASSVSEWVYDRLSELGMKAVLCHPLNIRRILGKKNDEIDAGFLVDSYRLGVLPLSWVAPPELRTLRQLVRRSSFLVKQRTQAKNRVHGILRRKGIRLINDDGEDEGSVFAKRNRESLLAVGDSEIPVLLDIIDGLDEKKKMTESEVAAAAEIYEDVRNLLTIPGFGPLVALAVFAEVGDVSRFSSADSVAAYFGLVPGESQSGETLVRGHITRRGSSHVRHLLGQAAWIHVSRCPQSSLSHDYRRISKRAGKKRAIVGVARRLAKVAYWIMREKRGFRMNGRG